jgi:hypothetical protein
MMRPAREIGDKSAGPKVVFLGRAAAGMAPELPDAPGLDAAAGLLESVARSEPLRLGPRALLIGAFAASVLVALSGAFLIGLAVVGVVAAVVAAVELVQRHLWRPAKAPAGALDHQVGF